MRAIFLFAVLAVSLSGCGMFGKPALPRRASIASLNDAAVDDFASRIRRAEVIYFPVESLDRSVADLIRVLRDDAKPLAIAWQGLSVDDQIILDQLGTAPAGDSSVGDRLTWHASGPSRESRQVILRANADLPQLAIGLPKVSAGELEKFAEEHEGIRDLRDAAIPKSYRVHLMAKLFAAEKIVTYMNAHPSGRMLIFVPRRDLDRTGGVPDFVTQKIKARQLILDVGQGSNGERPRLLTSARRGIVRRLL